MGRRSRRSPRGAAAALLAAILAACAGATAGADGSNATVGPSGATPRWAGAVAGVAARSGGCGGAAGAPIARVTLQEAPPAAASGLECRFALVDESAAAWEEAWDVAAGAGPGARAIPLGGNITSDDEFWRRVRARVSEVEGLEGAAAFVSARAERDALDVTAVTCEIPPVAAHFAGAPDAGALAVTVAWIEADASASLVEGSPARPRRTPRTRTTPRPSPSRARPSPTPTRSFGSRARRPRRSRSPRARSARSSGAISSSSRARAPRRRRARVRVRGQRARGPRRAHRVHRRRRLVRDRRRRLREGAGERRRPGGDEFARARRRDAPARRSTRRAPACAPPPAGFLLDRITLRWRGVVLAAEGFLCPDGGDPDPAPGSSIAATSASRVPAPRVMLRAHEFLVPESAGRFASRCPSTRGRARSRP